MTKAFKTRGLGIRPKVTEGGGGSSNRGGKYGSDLFGAGGGLFGMQRPVHNKGPAPVQPRSHYQSPKARQAEKFREEAIKPMKQGKSLKGKRVLEIKKRF